MVLPSAPLRPASLGLAFCRLALGLSGAPFWFPVLFPSFSSPRLVGKSRWPSQSNEGQLWVTMLAQGLFVPKRSHSLLVRNSCREVGCKTTSRPGHTAAQCPPNFKDHPNNKLGVVAERRVRRGQDIYNLAKDGSYPPASSVIDR